MIICNLIRFSRGVQSLSSSSSFYQLAHLVFFYIVLILTTDLLDSTPHGHFGLATSCIPFHPTECELIRHCAYDEHETKNQCICFCQICVSNWWSHCTPMIYQRLDKVKYVRHAVNLRMGMTTPYWIPYLATDCKWCIISFLSMHWRCRLNWYAWNGGTMPDCICQYIKINEKID